MRSKILWVGSILILINIFLFFVTRDYKLVNEALINVSIAISMVLLVTFFVKNEVNERLVNPFILMFITSGIVRVGIGLKFSDELSLNYIFLIVLIIPVLERIIVSFITLIDNSDK